MKAKIPILIFLAALLCSSVSAQEGNYSEVTGILQDAEEAVQRMEDNDIPTERADSLLTTANRSFRAQKTLAEQEGTPDFTRVEELTGNIQDIKDTALRVNDRLTALEERINELEETNLNLSGVKKAYRKVNTTFHNQRFEEAENQVENVYSEISEAQSVQTQVQAFASAQRQNIVGTYNSAVEYATEYWKRLSVAAVIFVIFGALARREYQLWRLEIRREDLMEKKKVIEDMIEEAQHEYYVKGKGSEISFKTRMNKFQEMKRDTEQDINALESQLKSIKGLPVISPEIKEKSEDFQAEGEIMEETGEVKGSLERISERRDQEQEEEEEKDEADRKDEEKEEDEREEDLEDKSGEDSGKYVDLLENDSISEAKEDIEEIDDPDFRALLKAERRNRSRKTMKEYLADRIEISQEELKNTEVEDEHRELLDNPVKDAKDGIEEKESPDYYALLKAEREDRDRKTMKEYLKEKIRYK